MTKFILVVSGFILIFLNRQLQAQHLVRDYVLDKHSPYQPDDPIQRGFFYRLQTGHAGFFQQGDDDLAKMHSPYISWHYRPGSPPRPISNFVSDFERKRTRFLDGAGACSIRSKQQTPVEFSAYEIAAAGTDAAADQLTPDKVLHLDRQVSDLIRSPLNATESSREPTSERFEQLRIQRMQR